jgi:hypothetical protein
MDNNSYNPIVGATVVFNGETKLSDVDGYAKFMSILPSATEYSYTVTGTGGYNSIDSAIILPFSSPAEYVVVANTVEVFAGLTSPSFYIGLGGFMPYFGAATINFDGVDYDYNAGFGGNTFNGALGVHTYVVTPADETKAILRGTVELTSDEPNKAVWLDVVDGHKIEIYTIDAASDPIEGTAVTLNGITVLTDNTGLALFDRYAAGSYTYTITKDGYNNVAATSLDVNTTDVQKIVTMEPLVYNVTFNVMSGTEILVGAVVTINGVEVITDASGNALFTAMPAGTYSYTVTKSGTYKDANGSVIVTNADVTENVDLINTTGIHQVSAQTVKLYPNPTSGVLNINLPVNNGTHATIRVTNILGSVILENKVVNGSSQVKLDVSAFENGIYFVTVKGSGYENTIKVVKK